MGDVQTEINNCEGINLHYTEIKNMTLILCNIVLYCKYSKTSHCKRV